MATTNISTIPLQATSIPRVRNAHPGLLKPAAPNRAPVSLTTRRNLLFLLTSVPTLTAKQPASLAEDIPLFGLRKKLRKVEEEAVELVKEGFETAEKGLETAEKGIEVTEKGVAEAEREIEEAVNFGGLAQAGTVAGAEVIGVLVATSVVNGILGPEGQEY